MAEDLAIETATRFDISARKLSSGTTSLKVAGGESWPWPAHLDPRASATSAAAPGTDRLCFYGLCGGVGVTTVATAVGFGRDGSAHGLPEPPTGRRLPLVAVTRSNAHGLERAQQEAAAWAAHQTAPWQQLGLVVVADAPGRLPRPLRELRKLVSGGWPRLWHIDWIEDLRIGEPPTSVTGERAIAKLRKDLLGLVPGLNQTKEERCPT